MRANWQSAGQRAEEQEGGRVQADTLRAAGAWPAGGSESPAAAGPVQRAAHSGPLLRLIWFWVWFIMVNLVVGIGVPMGGRVVIGAWLQALVVSFLALLSRSAVTL